LTAPGAGITGAYAKSQDASRMQ